MTDVLSLRSHQDFLASQIREQDKALFDSFSYCRMDGAFVNRVFIVYKAKGRDKFGDPVPPVILTTFKVVDFSVHPEFGSETLVQDTASLDETWVGHTPERMFGYDIFMQTPPDLHVQWAAKELGRDVRHTLIFGLILKTKTKAERCTDGETFCLTPKRFKSLYPNVMFDLN